MGLSFSSVKKAYEVMNELGLKNIGSFPPDWNVHVEERERENPIEDKAYGIDKKLDNGWENLFFFKKGATPEFVEKWNKLKTRVPNSSFQQTHDENPEYTCFGWF